MEITEITMCAIRDFARSPPLSIDSALIPCGGKSGRGGGERRGDMLEAINHVSIYFRRVARPVSWPSVSLRIRNCEMIVGLVADNHASPTGHYGSLDLPPFDRCVSTPQTSSCRTATGSRGSRHSLDW